jgi:DegV family protein with EDD domain
LEKEINMSGEKIVVITDSSASLPDRIMEGLDLRVIPLWLIWDNETFQDGVDILPQAFYSRLRNSSTLPSSTQPSVQEFVDFFQVCKKDAEAIVCVLASSKISGTVDSALSAKELVPDLTIRVIDSAFSAMGQGFIAVAAARAAAAGQSINEVVLTAERMRDAVNLLFVVDTLEYLHKGGRIGGAKWLLGTALNIKPLLHFKDGLITSLSQTRTKKKGVLELLDIAEERLGEGRMVEAAVVHVDCLDEGKQLMEMVKERFNPSNIYISDVSPVVGTHVGPGGLGLAFYPTL